MSLHEMEAWRAVMPENPRGRIASEQEEAAEFFGNPPQAILIPDCYIPKNPDLAQAFMEVRCSLAASVYHSSLYKSDGERPVMLSFAGIHKDGESAGSEKVAGLLIDREVPPGKIIALATTITGWGDSVQLHAIAKTQKELHGPLAIAVSDGYAPRARQDFINHRRAHKNFTNPIYVLYPSHLITTRLLVRNGIASKTRVQINNDLDLGRSGKLKHGPMEGVSWAISAIPPLRLFRQLAEETTHEGMRKRERSRYFAQGMEIAALQWQQVRKRHKELIEKEKIKGLRAFSQMHPELLRFPEIPSHG